jgi:glycosyltransferase involved in cell wall biosynthesis
MEAGPRQPERPIDRATVAAVIPAYFEEAHVCEVVKRTRRQLDHVLVVDDGSRDATAARAREGGAEVVILPENRGKGAAIKSGLRYWLDREAEFVLVLDADGQHLPEEIDRFLNVAAADDAALFIGNRMSDTGRMPLLRRAVNRYMSNQISHICGQHIPDTQCGFRMLHRRLIPHLLGGTSKFDYETEMLILASRNGFRIRSVRISTVYSDEVSSIRPIRDTLRFFQLMHHYRR